MSTFYTQKRSKEEIDQNYSNKLKTNNYER